MRRKYIINDEKFLMELLDCWNRLSALESGGVDNWEGYSWSIEDYLIDMEAESFSEAAENDLKTLIEENKIFVIED